MDFLYLEFQRSWGSSQLVWVEWWMVLPGRLPPGKNGELGSWRRRVCIGVAVFAQMTAGVIGADTYLLLVRWKGFLRLRSRYETVHRTVSPKFVARGARQIWSLLSGVRIHCAWHKNNW